MLKIKQQPGMNIIKEEVISVLIKLLNDFKWEYKRADAIKDVKAKKELQIVMSMP